MVAHLLILWVVGAMGKLVCFNRKDGITDHLVMIYAASMGTVTVSSIERYVVGKIIKALIDCISYADLFGVFIDDIGTGIFWEDAFEAGGTVAVVL